MRICICLSACSIMLPCSNAGIRTEAMPKGLMLNLDFMNARDGLIPNKAFYPLDVPQGPLNIETRLGQQMLVLLPDEGLDIPHSSLIQPDGSDWIVTVRLGAYPDGGDGMVISQCDDEHGYAIYLRDGAPHAVIRSGNCAMVLKEDRTSGITDCRRQMTTIELRIKADMALLTINNKRAAIVTLDAPLSGTNMPIRIGTHHRIPSIAENIPGMEPGGFFGAISSLKIWRQ